MVVIIFIRGLISKETVVLSVGEVETNVTCKYQQSSQGNLATLKRIQLLTFRALALLLHVFSLALEDKCKLYTVRRRMCSSSCSPKGFTSIVTDNLHIESNSILSIPDVSNVVSGDEGKLM